MIIYIDDIKYVYEDYTLEDALFVLKGYERDADYLGKHWKICNLNGEILKEGTFEGCN
jgi:hypothetical protein